MMPQRLSANRQICNCKAITLLSIIYELAYFGSEINKLLKAK